MTSLGDSATAHFHLPPQYLEAANINHETFNDVLFALKNEFDWPMLSATTAFTNSTKWNPSISGPSNSSYSVLRARNLCNHRDYQNIGITERERER